MSEPLFKSSEFLSNHLQWVIEDLDQNEDREDNQNIEMFRKFVALATSSLEGFAEPWSHKVLELWRQQPGNWKWAADHFYSREAVEGIAGRVSRFVRLSPVLVGVIPAKEVSVYLREATRCFIYGFFQASIALCRAALEAGLSEHFERKTGATPQMDLSRKIKGAVKFKLIDSKEEELAERIRKAGNRVLHEQSVTEKLAFDNIRNAREFLAELYRS